MYKNHPSVGYHHRYTQGTYLQTTKVIGSKASRSARMDRRSLVGGVDDTIRLWDVVTGDT